MPLNKFKCRAVITSDNVKFAIEADREMVDIWLKIVLVLYNRQGIKYTVERT